MDMKKVDVRMSTGIVTLKSSESQEYLQKVADYVDEKFNTIKMQNLSAAVDDRRRALLIAMNIADDFFKIKDRHVAMETENKKLTQKAKNLETKNTAAEQQISALNEQVQRLQAEVTSVTADFEDFLLNFDNKKDQVHEEDGVIPLAKANSRKAAN